MAKKAIRDVGASVRARLLALDIPVEPPDALTMEFARDNAKVRQWIAFAGNLSTAPASFELIVGDLSAFLMPIAAAARGKREHAR